MLSLLAACSGVVDTRAFATSTPFTAARTSARASSSVHLTTTSCSKVIHVSSKIEPYHSIFVVAAPKAFSPSDTVAVIPPVPTLHHSTVPGAAATMPKQSRPSGAHRKQLLSTSAPIESPGSLPPRPSAAGKALGNLTLYASPASWSHTSGNSRRVLIPICPSGN